MLCNTATTELETKPMAHVIDSEGCLNSKVIEPGMGASSLLNVDHRAEKRWNLCALLSRVVCCNWK